MKVTASIALLGHIAIVMLAPLSAAVVPAAVPSALSIFSRRSNIYKGATSIQQLWVTKSSMGEMGYMKIFSHYTTIGHDERLTMTMVMAMKIPPTLRGSFSSPPISTTKLIMYVDKGQVTYYNSANNKYLQKPMGSAEKAQLIGLQNMYMPILKKLGTSITNPTTFAVMAGTFNGNPVWWITVNRKAISAHVTAHSKQAISQIRTKNDSPDAAASPIDKPAVTAGAISTPTVTSSATAASPHATPSSMPTGAAMLRNAHVTMAFSQQTGEFLGMRIVQKHPGQPAPVVVTVTLLGSKLNAPIPPSTLTWVAPKGAHKEPNIASVFVGTFH